ncbi:MAG: kdtA [Caulobacteraceae bacterium]|nr:kdtA [Caulobacteraceae bacterium]
MNSLALTAYCVATAALEPLAPLLLKRRAARGKEDPDRLHERLGHPAIPRPAGDLVWLHGASVGESLSLLPLIDALARQRPQLTLLVTSGTVTSAELLGRRLPPGAIHQYAPIDAPGAARRFLAHWRPAAAVFVESELWPNLLLQAKAGGAALALLGARVSQASARGWRRAPNAARAMFGGFDLILAQDGASRARFEALGARVDGELDLKQAAAPLPCDEAELEALKLRIGSRPALLGASTHPGEDELIARAYLAVTAPSPLLIVVPRHPARGDAIAQTLRGQGLTLARRSLGEPLTAETQVYLADTLGELGLFFRLAQAVVMGGSLTGGVGGHNPLEPARLGLPVITGADVANFRETYAGLLAAHAALMAPDQAALDAAVLDLMTHPERAIQIGLRGKAHAERGGETLVAALAALAPLLPGAVA